MVTQQFLKEYFHYDPETGHITRIKRRGKRGKVGMIAGCKDCKGYIRITVDRKSYAAHHLAWLYMTGEWPSEQIDHRNLIKHDNRFSNLRLANLYQNGANKALRKDSVSGVKGVCWINRDQKWRARCAADGKRHHLGDFDRLEDAQAAYDAFAVKHHGEFYVPSTQKQSTM